MVIEGNRFWVYLLLIVLGVIAAAVAVYIALKSKPLGQPPIPQEKTLQDLITAPSGMVPDVPKEVVEKLSVPSGKIKPVSEKMIQSLTAP